MAQTTTGAQRLQIEHDPSNHIVSIAEGCAIMGDTHSTEVPSFQGAETEVGDIEPAASLPTGQRIEDIAPKHIELIKPYGRPDERSVLEPELVIPVVQENFSNTSEEVAPAEGEHVVVPVEESENVPVVEGELEEEEFPMEDAPAQGEPVAAIFKDPFVEGILEDASDVN
ncbi:hypothetical protein Taro_031647, partial [Colocasia esculenta]|nr:hypothetical protein [Colocasia esculenta]